ncbi:sensor domain-containing diguanylate cyclase [Niveibacterium sp. SC-1]|uniref:sensor domain-containing diguanylate cyclase n=1 Tax=Niveibacterium sp. SC-1 TaxID=3135646 RepID=UPI00311D3F93
MNELLRYAVLDTAPEPNFDRITSMAATIFDQPICTMAFADSDRHWFKSRHGVQATEMPRKLSFCDFTIKGNDVFVVRDALADSRFVGAPVVEGEPHVRFYAGAPLIVSSGAHVGTLCVLDTQPRDFSAKQEQVLMDLARITVELLEARWRQIRLAEDSPKIAHMARHDPLTQLANRRLFSDQMLDAVSQFHGEQEVAVLYIDLDRFKPVNDRLGHHVGDLLLQQVAERLRANTRSADEIARIGGDEFAVIQTGAGAQQHAADLAKRLIAALSVPYLLEGQSIVIGASVGIALMSDDPASPQQLFQRADKALYRAKSLGGNTYCFFDNSCGALG